MNRTTQKFAFQKEQLKSIKERILLWAKPNNILIYLDSNCYNDPYGKYELIVAVGLLQKWDSTTIKEAPKAILEQQDWIFGHLCYEYKNHIEHLSSKHTRNFLWDDFFFFQPETVLYVLKGSNVLNISTAYQDSKAIWQAILQTSLLFQLPTDPPFFIKKFNEENYCKVIEQLRAHIYEGDCYEINFCNEAYAQEVTLDPISVFRQLNHISPNPFAAYYRNDTQYLICASPERYLCKRDRTIIAQPIKGTSARGKTANEDQNIITTLKNNLKERAENVMITDLMRNDLARVCKTGTIEVPELFGIHTFPQVHQMISTIKGQLKDEIHLMDIIHATFPMGSMTGAPKIMVMELIEQYEKSCRELFSGCVGYKNPDGDFDFNVVIRSMQYNSESRYLSYQTGGAITYDSQAQLEWQETCIKALALEKAMQH